jgi:nucleoside-diphosphate-sugar epimerase
MKALITGVAGFIGSTLAEKLVRENHTVTGIDSFEDYYPEAVKRQNIATVRNNPNFRFVECDVAHIPDELLKDVEVVFHLAGQPGVRGSWGESFQIYVRNNIMASQILLERLKTVPSLKKIVYASSSSVYGNNIPLPFSESATLRPSSPYGITKLAAEHLFAAYSATWNVPVVCLRYFTVYGPRQRPDMAFHLFLRAGMLQQKLPVFGDGSQTRDFTFVDDIVRATMHAATCTSPESCTILNIGSGKRIPLMQVLDIINSVVGHSCAQVHTGTVKGDMKDTYADISRAERILGYHPEVELADGIHEQYRWMQANRQLLGF